MEKPSPFGDPQEIAPGVWWVGFWDSQAKLNCHPYLVVDGEEAVLIDGGSRPDFPTVMLKILKTGIAPRQIRALIYSHFDPDLCGSLPNLEDMVQREDLELISAQPNHMFLRHYLSKSKFRGLSELGFVFRFSSGRELRLVPTPFAHSAGSFVTFDPQSGVLFTSDLCGSAASLEKLFVRLPEECRKCGAKGSCVRSGEECYLKGIARFQKCLMPSEEALRHAVRQMRALHFKILAPQHGSIIPDPEDGAVVLDLLENLEGVGIDGILKKDQELSNLVL